jgi:putative transposase
VLQRQVARPRLGPADRLLLAAFSRSLPRSLWPSFFVSPATLLRWHRQLLARHSTSGGRRGGRREDGSGDHGACAAAGAREPALGIQADPG